MKYVSFSLFFGLNCDTNMTELFSMEAHSVFCNKSIFSFSVLLVFTDSVLVNGEMHWGFLLESSD